MIIYKVTNKTTGKAYIGQTLRGLNRRKAEHLRTAQRLTEQKYPTPLHVAISAEGSGNFTWEVLETCGSKDHMNTREKFYIQLLKTLLPDGYNQTTGGAIDSTMCEPTRFKIAESVSKLHKDPEYRARVYPKLKGLTPPNKGVPMSEEQKAKVSIARKAVHEDPTYTNPNVGQTRTEDQIANIKAGQAGKMAKGDKWQEAHKDQYTPEVREKMRRAKLGKKPANTKKVRCIETGEVFSGLSEAATKMNLPRQSIWLNIKGKITHVRSYHFEYAKETK